MGKGVASLVRCCPRGHGSALQRMMQMLQEAEGDQEEQPGGEEAPAAAHEYSEEDFEEYSEDFEAPEEGEEGEEAAQSSSDQESTSSEETDSEEAKPAVSSKVASLMAAMEDENRAALSANSARRQQQEPGTSAALSAPSPREEARPVSGRRYGVSLRRGTLPSSVIPLVHTDSGCQRHLQRTTWPARAAARPLVLSAHLATMPSLPTAVQVTGGTAVGFWTSAKAGQGQPENQPAMAGASTSGRAGGGDAQPV